MEEQLTASLLTPKSTLINKITRRSSIIRNSFQPPRASYISLQPKSDLRQEHLQWEKSQQDIVTIVQQNTMTRSESRRISRLSGMSEVVSGREEVVEKSLNDKVFNLLSGVQFKLYWFNLAMNVFMRVFFINLLVFLYIQNKIKYLYIFLSLEMLAIFLYFIIMIKMLFTKSDKESVYFQKIFNDREWSDIFEERVMRRHFGFFKILSKVKEFFNPFTKFDKDKKISFLCQQIFKRLQLVLVYAPFMVMYFLSNSDFVAPTYPYFNVAITSAICLQILRTTIQYLLIYIFN